VRDFGHARRDQVRGQIARNVTQVIARQRLQVDAAVKQPLEEQRDLLRAAVKQIVVEDGTIPSITLNGAFCSGANSSTQSNPYSPNRFPQRERRWCPWLK
jgi:hypothetical protein